jgi:hypothetical protein
MPKKTKTQVIKDPSYLSRKIQVIIHLTDTEAQRVTNAKIRTG